MLGTHLSGSGEVDAEKAMEPCREPAYCILSAYCIMSEDL